MDCDICGKPAVTRAFIEGAQLNVCQKCLRLGKEVYTRPQHQASAPATLKELEPVPSYGAIAREARIVKGLSTLDLAHKLQLQESVIKQLESETRFCGEAIARKLERELRITLLKSPGDAPVGTKPVPINLPTQRKSDAGFTLADFAKPKKGN